ncbi:hypothetical protein LTR85_006059 [Meristemomyces frigidus]|nr:hypothetical protein LTR85_006059 [Meristemomyces frigidus]
MDAMDAMDELFAVSKWNPPDRSPRAHAAGLAEIDSFFDSVLASPSPSSSPDVPAAAAMCGQLPADTAASQQPVASCQEASGNAQNLLVLAQRLSAPDSDQDFSTLTDDIAELETTAGQDHAKLDVGDAEPAASEQYGLNEVEGFEGLHLPSMILSHYANEQQQLPYGTLSHTVTFDEREQLQNAAARRASKQYFLHHEQESRQAYPLPDPPRLRPTLLPSLIPDIAILPDGTIDAPEHLPPSATKYSMFGEMRDEGESGDVSVYVQPLSIGESADTSIPDIPESEMEATDFGGRSLNGMPESPDLSAFADDGSYLSSQAFTVRARGNAAGQGNEGVWIKHEDVGSGRDETPLQERVRRVTMRHLEEALASKQQAGTTRMRTEAARAPAAAESEPIAAPHKRDRADSAADALLQPAMKKARTPVPTDSEEETEPEEHAYGPRLPEHSPISSTQVGRAWAQGMMAEKKPAAVATIDKVPTNEEDEVVQDERAYSPGLSENRPVSSTQFGHAWAQGRKAAKPPPALATTAKSSSPLTDLSDLDAPGSPEDEAFAERAKSRVSKKELNSIIADSLHKKLKISPSSAGKTRQQKQAHEDAKPNASAAVKRRRQGK